MEVRALFDRFVSPGVNIDDDPSRGSRIKPTLKLCEHNRVTHASEVTVVSTTNLHHERKNPYSCCYKNFCMQARNILTNLCPARSEKPGLTYNFPPRQKFNSKSSTFMSPCPPITWHNVLHARKVPHFTIILSRSIVDPLWLSIAQSHTFVLNLQHLNPVARCWRQALNLILLSIGLFPKREKHRSARINSQAIFYSTSIAILL